jgi:hypothetical protein
MYWHEARELFILLMKCSIFWILNTEVRNDVKLFEIRNDRLNYDDVVDQE